MLQLRLDYIHFNPVEQELVKKRRIGYIVVQVTIVEDERKSGINVYLIDGRSETLRPGGFLTT
jgi:hypothetical protein